jgi:UDP-N-acetylglucosamine:LPS N-acetylglucosamine transferase
MIRVLAVASGGGHWEQLMLLSDVLEPFDTYYATTNAELIARAGITRASVLPDSNRDRPLDAARTALAALRLVIRVRPRVVISTGAAPGFFCILFGRMIGARTLWLDSVANAEQLSMCGKLSRVVASRCLTQWEHLAGARGPNFAGALL